MFCNHCGSRNPDGSNFCSNCGAALASIPFEESESDSPLYTVEIFRESQMFVINPPVNLAITGTSITKKLSIANGEAVTLRLPPDTYEFYFSYSFRKRVLTVDLQHDIHIDMRWNKFSGALEARLT